LADLVYQSQFQGAELMTLREQMKGYLELEKVLVLISWGWFLWGKLAGKIGGSLS